MTQNQISYWNLIETQRSNKERERNNRDVTAETVRHNVAVEGETSRHNVQQEQIGWGNLNESARHNKVTERETTRHNKKTEAQTDYANKEVKRHNIQTEQIGWGNLQETNRHNLNQEAISRESNSIQREGNYLNYNLGIYKTDMQHADTIYTANKRYQTDSERNDITRENNLINNLGKYPATTAGYYLGKSIPKGTGSKVVNSVSKLASTAINNLSSVSYRPYSPNWATSYGSGGKH